MFVFVLFVVVGAFVVAEELKNPLELAPIDLHILAGN